MPMDEFREVPTIKCCPYCFEEILAEHVEAFSREVTWGCRRFNAKSRTVSGDRS